MSDEGLMPDPPRRGQKKEPAGRKRSVVGNPRNNAADETKAESCLITEERSDGPSVGVRLPQSKTKAVCDRKNAHGPEKQSAISLPLDPKWREPPAAFPSWGHFVNHLCMSVKIKSR